MRVLYAKGGRAIAEAERLFPRAGTLADGGPDKYLLCVLAHAGESPFRLVSFGPKNERRTITGRDAIEYGVRPKGSRLASKLAYIRESLRFLIETIHWKPTHLLCGIDGPFAVFAYLAARITRARFVFLVHTALSISSTSAAYKAAHRIVTKRADTVIVHGPFLRDQALALGADASKIIEFNNGLDDNHRSIISELPEKSKDNPNPQFTFLFAGRIEEDKGIFDLLEAFARVKTAAPAKLVYVGTGNALDALRERAAAFEEGEIEILGPVPHERIFALMKDADVVVTPTQSVFPEGRCMTVMEALFVGTPVIAPGYGPFPYLVSHERNGLIYEPDSIDCLESAMRKLLTNQQITEELRDAALASGNELTKPRTTFFQALKQTFP